jgi:hypothetical protein
VGERPVPPARRQDGVASLDPDEIADTAWDLYTKRDRAEAVFSSLG